MQSKRAGSKITPTPDTWHWAVENAVSEKENIILFYQNITVSYTEIY